MTRIYWGFNISYQSSEIDWDATEERRKQMKAEGKDISYMDYVRVPCIRVHKKMYFELCDICGNFIPYGRVSRQITTCSPKCNTKKWDAIISLVIERERNAAGVRPKSFWGTISLECFNRDNHTCQKCGKTAKQLKQELEELQNQLSQEKDCCKRNHNLNSVYQDYVLHCHHIKQIKDGGDNRLENLITFCGKCHKIEHSHANNVRRLHKPLNV